MSILESLTGSIVMEMAPTSNRTEVKRRIFPATRELSQGYIKEIATAACGTNATVWMTITRVVTGPFPVRDTFWQGEVETLDEQDYKQHRESMSLLLRELTAGFNLE